MKHMLPSQLCADGETEDCDLYWLEVHTGRMRRSQNPNLDMGTRPCADLCGAAGCLTTLFSGPSPCRSPEADQAAERGTLVYRTLGCLLASLHTPAPSCSEGQGNSQEFFRKTVLLINLKKRSA